MTNCKADGCGRKILAKGLCDKHYRRARKRGDGSFEDRRRYLHGGTALERYENQIDRSGGPDACHPWLGAQGNAYGVFWDGTYTPGGHCHLVKVHAWGYRQKVGALEPGEVVRHLCHNKLCQNERHWAKGTPHDNARDSMAAGIHLGPGKMTSARVVEARRRYAAGGLSQRALAAEYGISEGHLRNIVNYRVWKHVGSAEQVA
ncbi:hypothetical protein [Streptomyces sp. N35]|uniref:hypothetical protein n=1 Tax=Streptomyces sp. N35 TaxID=2795730 RepID=UPI0018F3B4D1|nr:hypothetical protein [Streptomyces sp. N35]